MNLGILALHRADDVEAAELFEKALQLDPKNPEAKLSRLFARSDGTLLEFRVETSRPWGNIWGAMTGMDFDIYLDTNDRFHISAGADGFNYITRGTRGSDNWRARCRAISTRPAPSPPFSPSQQPRVLYGPVPPAPPKERGFRKLVRVVGRRCASVRSQNLFRAGE